MMDMKDNYSDNMARFQLTTSVMSKVFEEESSKLAIFEVYDELCGELDEPDFAQKLNLKAKGVVYFVFYFSFMSLIARSIGRKGYSYAGSPFEINQNEKVILEKGVDLYLLLVSSGALESGEVSDFGDVIVESLSNGGWDVDWLMEKVIREIVSEMMKKQFADKVISSTFFSMKPLTP